MRPPVSRLACGPKRQGSLAGANRPPAPSETVLATQAIQPVYYTTPSPLRKDSVYEPSRYDFRPQGRLLSARFLPYVYVLNRKRGCCKLTRRTPSWACMISTP